LFVGQAICFGPLSCSGGLSRVVVRFRRPDSGRCSLPGGLRRSAFRCRRPTRAVARCPAARLELCFARLSASGDVRCPALYRCALPGGPPWAAARGPAGYQVPCS